MSITIEKTDFLSPSDVPPGTYAGTVVVDDGISPSIYYLYSENGRQFTNKQAFYESLFNRGFRYFGYAYKGGVFEICKTKSKGEKYGFKIVK